MLFTTGREQGMIRVGDFQIIFENCHIKPGLTLQFENSVNIENCIIEKDCSIGSDLNSCSYFDDGILEIRESHRSFKFNRIDIPNGIFIQNSSVIFDGDGSFKVDSSTCLSCHSNSMLRISNTGTIEIETGTQPIKLFQFSNLSITNSGFLKIRSIGCGFECFKSSSLQIENEGDFEIDSDQIGISLGQESFCELLNSGSFKLVSYSFGIDSRTKSSFKLNNTGKLNIKSLNGLVFWIGSETEFENSEDFELNIDEFELLCTSKIVSKNKLEFQFSSFDSAVSFTEDPSTWNGMIISIDEFSEPQNNSILIRPIIIPNTSNFHSDQF